MKTPSPYQIEQALSAWMSARARILSDDLASDEAALAEMLGPETGDVMDILQRLLRGAMHAKDMAEAAGDRIEEIQARRDRYRRRADTMRGVAFSIMDAIGERKIELPDVTATIAAGRQSVVITDEAAIPDQFVRTKREPDKAALLAALKVGYEIPGAVLANGIDTLQLRTK